MSEQPPLFPQTPDEPSEPSRHDSDQDAQHPQQDQQPEPEFRDPYSSQNRRAEQIIEQRDGEDLGAEQTGLKSHLSLAHDSGPDDSEGRSAGRRRHPSAGTGARPLSGPLRGDSETDTGKPHYHGPVSTPTDEEKQIGLDNIRKLRSKLDSQQNGES